MEIEKASLRDLIKETANMAKLWFEEKADTLDREDFLKKGSLKNAGKGAVYVYFDSFKQAIYVGQTKRNIKARLYDQTSPHLQKPWFKAWSQVRYLSIEDDVLKKNRKMDRLLLEFLLILAYSPSENVSPEAVSFEDLFT